MKRKTLDQFTSRIPKITQVTRWIHNSENSVLKLQVENAIEESIEYSNFSSSSSSLEDVNTFRLHNFVGQIEDEHEENEIQSVKVKQNGKKCKQRIVRYNTI